MKVEWSTDPGEFANISPAVPPARIESVIDAVEDLPEHCRAVINALFWEGLSIPRAIISLGVSPATFYRHWKEAKGRLREMLGGDLPGAFDRPDGDSPVEV